MKNGAELGFEWRERDDNCWQLFSPGLAGRAGIIERCVTQQGAEGESIWEWLAFDGVGMPLDLWVDGHPHGRTRRGAMMRVEIHNFIITGTVPSVSTSDQESRDLRSGQKEK